MKRKKFQMHSYLDMKLVDDIYKGMGMPNPANENTDDFDDGIKEDINEDI